MKKMQRVILFFFLMMVDFQYLQVVETLVRLWIKKKKKTLNLKRFFSLLLFQVTPPRHASGTLLFALFSTNVFLRVSLVL